MWKSSIGFRSVGKDNALRERLCQGPPRCQVRTPSSSSLSSDLSISINNLLLFFSSPHHLISPIYYNRYFWEVVHSLPPEQQKKLLFFSTGSDRSPIGKYLTSPLFLLVCITLSRSFLFSGLLVIPL